MSAKRKDKHHEPTFASASRDIYVDILASFLQRSDSGLELPFSRLLGILRARDWATLLRVADTLNLQQYDNPTSHFVGRQLSALIRKYPFTSTEVPELNPEAKAWEKFLESEARCNRYNRYFRVQRKFRQRYSSEKQLMRSYLLRVLGDEPNLLEIYDKCDFGPGSNIGVGGIGTSVARKLMSPTWSVTPLAAKYLRGAMWNNFHIREFLLTEEKDSSTYCIDKNIFEQKLDSKLKYVGYNKVTFVPKTATVHRTIAVEPLGNSFLQKGVDEWMRGRLKRVARIDLSDQTVNQRLAHAGSLEGHDPYVTIDLSSASDSISIELVRELVPSRWFSFLNDLRSPSYLLNGKVEVPYHKFCSMGNGFCFPLETAIFAAVCHTAYKITGYSDDFSVYGDDIIVRQSHALLVIELLQALGFRVNSDKTFIHGPFRESCGADYFRGVAVKPITLDERLDNVRSVIKIHNQFRRHPRMSDLADTLKLYERIPKGKRYMRYLEGQIDTAFEVDLDVFMSSPYARWNRDLQTWSWKEFLIKSRSDNIYKSGPSALLVMAALRGSTSSQPYTFRRLTDTRIRRTVA